MPTYPKAIRTDHETFIEIDAKKGKHPYIHCELDLDSDKLLVLIDCNDTSTVGDGKLIAGLSLSQKKQRALRDFLCGLDLGDDEIE